MSKPRTLSNPGTESNTDQVGNVFVIAAPSGGGKTTLTRALIDQDDCLRLSVSHTTRPARPGESHGVHYFFVNESEFESLIEQQAFLEYALVFDDYKGTTRAAVEQQIANGYHVLLDIDWQGARQVRLAIPGSHSIFILPPSLEVLKERLAGRGQDSEKEIAKRMSKARSEISHWDEFDFVVINDDFQETLKNLQSIIKKGKPVNPVSREKLETLLAELLEDR
ncbi:MAG TPA: guanylate kinase [Xanthomonadales bacterium]|nr:guanylate kinase [Xanthomonadales bacterium]